MMSHPRGETMADRADPHALYETAVQQPIQVIELIEEAGRQLARRPPRVLREDFCGTAHLASTWVRSGRGRRAVAVDRDAVPIRYAEQHSRRSLGGAAGRLRLVERDVVRCRARADVLVALNFSWFVYRRRPQLLRYLRHAHRCLQPAGLLLLDLYGGPGAMRPGTDVRSFDDFDYLWEQASYDPLTSGVVNHIHFRFPDGSRLERAFTYRWRLWTIVELRELLEEAGFPKTAVCFETEQGLVEELDEPHDAWVAWLFAVGQGRPGR